MTERVQEILSWYIGENIGVRTNLARILNHGTLAGSGRAVILPVDQGFEHGPARSFAPNPAGYDPRYHFRLAIEAGCNAHAAPLGAVTQPWKQHVEFRGLPPDEFRAFHKPDYAKIAWTFEVEPLDASSSVFRTETRVLTTDAASREKFRRYWSFLSPGILLIRYEMLRLVKSKAQSRQQKANKNRDRSKTSRSRSSCLRIKRRWGEVRAPERVEAPFRHSEGSSAT